MKKMFNSFLSVALLLAATTAVADDSSTSSSKNIQGVPFFNQRSQGDDLTRRMVGEVHFLTRCDTECLSGAFSATAEYTRTFRQSRLAEALTFNGGTSMLFGASNGTDVNVNAANFLLAQDIDGTATFNPRVENFVFDLNLRLNLDEWLCGLFFEIGLPINWTRWNAGLSDDVNGAIVTAWAGQNTSTTVPGTMNFAKLDGRQTKTSVADLDFVLGYNFWCTDCGHLGLSLRVTAPTGTRPSGEFFFEPVAGNGKHTGVGVGLTSHYMLWENACDQSFSFWFDAEVQHLFKAKQTRTFDLTAVGSTTGSNVGSRYLLLKQFNSDGDATGTLVRGPNVLTQDVNVTIGAVGEAVFLFNYQHCGWSADFGYNLWGRTNEKIKLRGDGIAADTYGVAFELAGSPNATATNSATISSFGTADAGSTGVDGTPVFISNDNLALDAGAFPSTLSHKVFAHFSYAWENCDYAPFIGVGGFGEFSGRGNRALNQWGVWGKGGFAFQ